MRDIILVQWVDVCYFSGISANHKIDDTEKPVFISVGIDFGAEKMFGKDFQKVCYSELAGGGDCSIVYIPVGCILRKKIIGEIL